jgi:hypothetical protein
MREFVGLLLSVALPWVAGTLWLRAALGHSGDRGRAVELGYGYLVGMCGVTLVMRALDAAGQPWGIGWIALPIGLLTLGAYLRVRRLQPSGRGAGQGELPASMSREARVLIALLLLLTFVRIALVAAEALLTPLIPYDAWAQWATKSRVWYEFRTMASFVPNANWFAAEGNMHFTDVRPGYPGTVPLFQVWTALSIGRWDESLVKLPWVAAYVSLGIAFYAQVRRIGASALKSVFGTYVLLSLPFLTIHVALAGIADLFVAVAYGLAAMALGQWAIGRRRSDAALALLMALVCASLKQEGLVWALTLVPGAVVVLDRRAGLALMGTIVLATVAYLFAGPSEFRMFGYVLKSRFDDVSRPVYAHLFEMDNWHLLWYAFVALVVLNYRLLTARRLLATGVTVLSGLGFIFVVYFFSTAAEGIRDDSLTNRLPLQLVPALVFYLALILDERSRRSNQLHANAAVL